MWYKEDLYSRYHYVDYIVKHKNLISNHTNFGVSGFLGNYELLVIIIIHTFAILFILLITKIGVQMTPIWVVFFIEIIY